MGEVLTTIAVGLAEKGIVPEVLLSWGIRKACGARLAEVKAEYDADPKAAMDRFIQRLASSEIAEATDEANEQHYELPPAFFELVLGPRRKYSGCDWPAGVNELAEAELSALETVVERAGLVDGQRVLELGCGWGSLSLFMASKFPGSQFVSVSNSSPQREFIESECVRLGISNLTVVTADINIFEPEGQFDRIVTIEMLEHVRNYSALFSRVSTWLNDDGRMFVHVFRHKDYAYTFETEGSKNWMGQHFFTGGVMPSHSLFSLVQDSLVVEHDWMINGRNYEKTADAWLRNLESRKGDVMDVLEAHYGDEDAPVWFERWRMFFIACRELFGFDGGNEWGVSHYLFKKP